MDIKNRQQLMNIIANDLEVYEFGKFTIKPVEIIEYEDIEIVIYKKKDKLKAMDYESFLQNVKLKAVFT